MQIRDIGSGNFGVAKLMRNRVTNELVAVKFIERGERVRRGSGAGTTAPSLLFLPAARPLDGRGWDRQCSWLFYFLGRYLSSSTPVIHCARPAACCLSTQVDKNVEREILNHRMLLNANVVSFKEVCVYVCCVCARACYQQSNAARILRHVETGTVRVTVCV